MAETTDRLTDDDLKDGFEVLKLGGDPFTKDEQYAVVAEILESRAERARVRDLLKTWAAESERLRQENPDGPYDERKTRWAYAGIYVRVAKALIVALGDES